MQDRRHLTDEQLAAVDDGRVFTGHQGLGLKLIDQIGDERAAIAWLDQGKKIAANLPVRDYRLHSRLDDLPFLHAAAIALLDAAGLNALARRFGELGGAGLDRFNLDGLLALWQPAAKLSSVRGRRRDHDQVRTRSTHFREEPAPVSA